MFYNDLKIKINFLKVTNPGKLIPFSGHPFDFVEINLKPLVPVQPFGESKSCKIQGINPGQVTENAGNVQNICSKVWCFESYQSDGSEIPPKKTIRFDGHFEPYQKPFKKYHIKHTHQSDVLIIPFDFTILAIPTNRIYPTCYLLFFVGVVLCPFDHWPVVQNDKQPLTIEYIKMPSLSNHIQTTSPDDKKRINLIYAPTFDKQFHSLSMTNHSLSIIFSHFLMIGNDKFYLHSLSICTYIKSSICIYNIRFYGLISALAQRGGLRGIRPPLCIYNKLSTYTYMCIK